MTSTSFGKRMTSIFLATLILLSNFVCAIPVMAFEDNDIDITDDLKDSYSITLSYEREWFDLTFKKASLSLYGKELNGTGEQDEIEQINKNLYGAFNLRGNHIKDKSTMLFPTEIDLSLNELLGGERALTYTLTVNDKAVIDGQEVKTKGEPVSLYVDPSVYPYPDSAFLYAGSKTVTPDLNDKTISTTVRIGDQYDVLWTASVDKIYSIVDENGNPISISGVSVNSSGTVCVSAAANDANVDSFRVRVDAQANGHIVTAMTQSISIVNNPNLKTANYTVNHYKQNLENNEYTLAQTQPMVGGEGKLTEVVAKEFSGFTNKDIIQQVIVSDASTVVNVYYDRNIHTVTFDANGGTGSKSYNLKFGAEIPSPTVYREGYTFSRWDPIVMGTMPDEDLVYKAKWLANTATPYTVKHYQQNLNDDGYTLIENDTQTLAGITDTLTSATAREYTGFTATEITQKNINGDGSTQIDIYYTRNNYTITFQPQNGAPAINMTNRYGEMVQAPVVENKNYQFLGWFTEPVNGVLVSFDKLISEDITVYAHWNANTYTLTFDAGEGVCPVPNIQAVYGSEYTSLPTASRYGYTFIGWFMQDGTQIKQGDTVLISENQTVYARWSLNEYTATFVADEVVVGISTFTVENPTVIEPSVPDKVGYTGKWVEYTLTDSNIIIDVAYTAVEYTATFKANGIVVGVYTFTVENLSVPEPNVPNKIGYSGAWEFYELTISDITINAVYTPIEYIATFVADGKVVGKTTFTVENYNLTEPSVPNKSGYIGSWENYTLTASDITINAVYNAVIYTATFVADGQIIGTDTFTVENMNITEPSVPNKTGYLGVWENYTLSTSDITINAVYEINKYTITFDANGGTCSVPYWQNVEYGTAYGKLPIASRQPEAIDGYTIRYVFLGWYTAAVGGAKVNPEDVVTSDVTLYAYYFEVFEANTYLVTFDANGGYCDVDTLDASYGYTYGTLPTPTKDGYDFVGWYTSRVGGTMIKETSIVEITEDTILYAQWEVANYSKYFNIDDKGMVSLKPEYAVVYDNSVGRYVFGELNSYLPSQIKIPSSINGQTVKSISPACFIKCSKLKTIVIPDTVIQIGREAFADCVALEKVALSENLTELSVWLFCNCISLKDIELPSRLAKIGGGAFSNCKALKEVKGSENVTDIDDFAFFNCKELKNFNFSNNIKKLSSGVFAACDKLTGITIPNSVTLLNAFAFSGCKSLTSINIPASLTTINSRAFGGTLTGIFTLISYDFIPYGCTSLKSINVDTNNPAFTSVDGALLNKAKTTIIYCPAGKTGKYTIPNTVTSIGEFSFEYGLLTNIIIPSAVKSIGAYAFDKCENLASLSIPASTTDIGMHAFDYCESLTAINVDSNNPKYSSVNGALLDKEKTTLIKYPCGKKGAYVVPNTVTHIVDFAFQYSRNLTGVTVPVSVTKIGNRIFEDCLSLETLTYLGTYSQWCEISKSTSWNSNSGIKQVVCSDAVVNY